jgi:hypothetical protein
MQHQNTLDASDSEDNELITKIKPKVTDIGNKLFKNLLDEFPDKLPEDTVTLLNSALFFMTIVQNSFYTYEAREPFADLVCNAMKLNKGEDPNAQLSPTDLPPENLEKMEADRTYLEPII